MSPPADLSLPPSDRQNGPRFGNPRGKARLRYSPRKGATCNYGRDSSIVAVCGGLRRYATHTCTSLQYFAADLPTPPYGKVPHTNLVRLPSRKETLHELAHSTASTCKYKDGHNFTVDSHPRLHLPTFTPHASCTAGCAGHHRPARHRPAPVECRRSLPLAGQQRHVRPRCAICRRQRVRQRAMCADGERPDDAPTVVVAAASARCAAIP